MSGAIDPTSDRATYRQIADRLRDSILSGDLIEGGQLPSERALMDSYGAARGTVRQAIGLLRSEGLIEVTHGRGGFVRRRPPVKRLAHDRFARRHREAGKGAYNVELETSGRTGDVEVLEIGPVAAPPEIAERLRCASGERLLVRRRRYWAEGQPMELAASYLPWELVEGTRITEKDTGPGGIYARLEEIGQRLDRFVEEVSSRMPTPEEAKALRLTAGIPVFLLVRTAYTVDGRAVEVCDTTMAADRYVLVYELPAS